MVIKGGRRWSGNGSDLLYSVSPTCQCAPSPVSLAFWPVPRERRLQAARVELGVQFTTLFLTMGLDFRGVREFIQMEVGEAG